MRMDRTAASTARPLWVLLTLLVGCGSSSSGGTAAAPPDGGGADPEVVAAATAVAETWVTDSPPEALEWDWGEGVLAFGLLTIADVLDRDDWRTYVRDYIVHHQEDNVPILWSDHTTPAIAATDLFRAGDDSGRPIQQRVVNYVMNQAPRTELGGIRHLGLINIFFLADWWVDSLFHWVPTLARESEITGDPSFIDEGVVQMLLYLRAMQDPVTDLITHAYIDRDPLPGVQVPGFDEEAFWARGNSWVIAALVDLLSFLPEDHPDRAELVDRTERLAAALVSVQSADGRFHTVLLDDTTYLETAGSALITYGLARGVREGLLGEDVATAARLGMDGLMNVLVVDEETGRTEVKDTSLGTNPIAASYPNIPVARQVSYGVGGWLLAASEFSREWRPDTSARSPAARLTRCPRNTRRRPGWPSLPRPAG